MSKRHVLITGAAGRVGTILRQQWGDRYQLRLADVAAVDDLAAHEQFLPLDVTDLAAFVSVCEGIDTLVHLAADPSPRADFYETLLQRNIIGGYNGFEAARQAGCRRLVFASSIHAVLGHGQSRSKAAWDALTYPQNLYGATKCWGEALARVYDAQHSLSCICVRLTSPSFDQKNFDGQAQDHGISERDAANLFGSCVDADDEVGFAIINGVSQHKDSWFDVSCSDPRVAFTPQDGTAFSRPQ
ncbi:MAG: NAD(P)-dependent oxidoreductase [Gemmatimonadetes bacterium]|jgi:nucleoside-diphosphate-sugar epimerase|nr:NAD(P)-dependent oxidoreductase [Gemmatimonadota bacterium]MBT5145266.1 NAD(P)-dependent oxidoreductase [Gemmatimonadota bacterium]MBT5589647.1 NAD(P)-dependent oxidoreductase [Gemmatimonadota bacterium]MBT5965296.1 NAD(P)-dependent oxidoreductase [Gemmatimonadota bacterium]